MQITKFRASRAEMYGTMLAKFLSFGTMSDTTFTENWTIKSSMGQIILSDARTRWHKCLLTMQPEATDIQYLSMCDQCIIVERDPIL
jgi:hypothetical protein